jgi:hypothetical protein
VPGAGKVDLIRSGEDTVIVHKGDLAGTGTLKLAGPVPWASQAPTCSPNVRPSAT